MLLEERRGGEVENHWAQLQCEMQGVGEKGEKGEDQKEQRDLPISRGIWKCLQACISSLTRDTIRMSSHPPEVMLSCQAESPQQQIHSLILLLLSFLLLSSSICFIYISVFLYSLSLALIFYVHPLQWTSWAETAMHKKKAQSVLVILTGIICNL